jgi:predicted nucleic acid-binding protein
MKALLDTDTLSETFKAKNKHVVEKAAAFRIQWGCYTFSVLTVMEMVKGFSRLQREEALTRFLVVVNESEVLPLDRISAELAGRIYSDLERAGRPIGIADVLIAAIAIQHSLPLVTGSTSDYVRIQEVGYPLLLKNWREPS